MSPREPALYCGRVRAATGWVVVAGGALAFAAARRLSEWGRSRQGLAREGGLGGRGARSDACSQGEYSDHRRAGGDESAGGPQFGRVRAAASANNEPEA